tara:strand:- start:462 stop:935 length:474 start_codon:yes stop_codon:yes gene_type:complete
MKNIKIISILVFLILLSSCGFKPINQKNGNLINFRNIKVTGEQRIAYALKNNLLLISNNNSKNNYDAEIKINKKKNSKIKNSSGKITRYELSINVSLELTNLDDNIKINKSFVRSGDYNVAVIHSDTIDNEKNLTKNIIQQISDDAINFISLSIRKK